MKPNEMSNVDRLAIELGHAGRNAIPYIDDGRNVDRPFKLMTYRPLPVHAGSPRGDRAARRVAQWR